jgi:hypothetical protein
MVDRLGGMFSCVARLARGELAQLKLRQMWRLAAGLVVAVAALFGECIEVNSAEGLIIR